MLTAENIDKSLYPFHSNFLTLKNNLRYHYLDEGEGQPVLMLHGNPTWSFYYRDLIKGLRHKFRCIVPDHMGCGLSDKPGDDQYQYTLQSRVEDLERLIDHLSLNEKITLVLHDWGGMIGMAYAHKHPQKIKKIVLLNTSAFHLPETKKFPFLLKLSRTKLGEFLILNFNAFSAYASIIGCKRKRLEKSIRKTLIGPYNNPKNRIATLRFVQDIPLSRLDPGHDLITNVQNNLKQFSNLPILICWGMKDFVFDIHFLNEWKKLFPMAKIHEFHDCGHYILEDAKEEILPLIKSFLEKECELSADETKYS